MYNRDLTPEERRDLVTRAIERWRDLGLVLIPITSHQPWKVDCEAVRDKYTLMYETMRELCWEVDWPSPRPLGGHLERP